MHVGWIVHRKGSNLRCMMMEQRERMYSIAHFGPEELIRGGRRNILFSNTPTAIDRVIFLVPRTFISACRSSTEEECRAAIDKEDIPGGLIARILRQQQQRRRRKWNRTAKVYQEYIF